MAQDFGRAGNTEQIGAKPIEKTNGTEVNKLIYLLGLPKTGEYFVNPKVKENFKIARVGEREYIRLPPSPKLKFPIGRYDGTSFNDNAVVLNDSAVSGRHCAIGYNPELGNQLPHYFLVDLGSTNGTKIKGIFYDDNWQKQDGELILSKSAPVILPLYSGESAIISLGKLGMDLEFRVK